tara:strand:- start:35 stop:979 length:945 start_codon:yes stop_codon:yes gene_type:complete
MSTNDIKHLAVETIYLVPDASEGQRCYLWCDDPAPGLDMDPSESVEYLRKDVHDAIIAKQANAAQQGMDAAKSVASSELEQAKRLNAESSPASLESERAANALLTERIAELEADCAALAKERDALRIAEDHQISMRQMAENHIARLRSALAYASDYLNSNKLNIIGYASKAHCEMRFALAAYSMIGSRLHADDIAVDKFSLAMKEKLSASREKGRGGWEDPEVCTATQLAEMLISHLEKGNGGTFQDIANFAMMLHQRGEDPFILATSLARRDLIQHAEALEEAAGETVPAMHKMANWLLARAAEKRQQAEGHQ